MAGPDQRDARNLLISWSCSGTGLNFRHGLGLKKLRGGAYALGLNVIEGQANIVAGSVTANTLQLNAVSTAGKGQLIPIETASIEGGVDD